MGKMAIWFGALVLAIAVSAHAAYAAEDVDEVTVYGKDRSVISGSPVADTRAGSVGTVAVDTSELQAGLIAGESQMSRQESKLEKPELADAVRDKPDLTPDHRYQIDWKLTLLIGLLESSRSNMR